MQHSILIVEDNRKLAHVFEQALWDRFETHLAHSLAEARSCARTFQGLLLDLQLPDGEGLGLIGPIREANPSCVIIVVTAYGTIQKAVEALRLGAVDFLEKPVDLDALVERFSSQLAPRDFQDIVAESDLMREVLEMARRVAPTPFPVLITGETGTGKDVLARFIHEQSGLSRFVSLNCANLTPELTDSLLFGHLKGSFTGAVDARQGLVSAADGGTLFLDEIGDLPPGLQPKLLRFLDSGTYLPLGSTQECQSSARIMAATNKELRDAFEEDKFREDLYFRLSNFPVHIPPLRKRKEDILPLATLHLGKVEKLLGYKVVLSDDAKKVLLDYRYPGNIRELFNLLDRAALLTGGRISGPALRPLLAPTLEDESPARDFWSESKTQALRKEKELIGAALAAAGGNKAAAARALRVSYKTLLNKMKTLGF
jgi:two-component system response regulator AtoC